MESESKLVKRILNLFKNNIGAVAAINLALSVVALLKDISLAAYLGTSSAADALMLAFFVPDMVGNNLLAAAAGTACVPVFSSLLSRNYGERLHLLMRNIIFFFSTISIFTALIFYVFRESIIGMLGAGLAQDVVSTCIKLFVIILPAVILFPIAAIGSAAMNSLNRFKIPAASPLVFNAVFLLSIMYAYCLKIPVSKGVFMIALFITIAVVSMVILIWMPLLCKQNSLTGAKHNLPPSVFHIAKEESEDIKSVLRMFIPYFIILLLSQSVFYIERYIASHFATGCIAGLNYAYRIAQFPVWVFVAAITTVVLPSMSKSVSLGKTNELKDIFAKSLRLVFTITIPLASVMYIMRTPITYVLLRRGAFDNYSVYVTSGMLAGFSLAIVAQSITFLSFRVFLAVNKILLPMAIFLLSSIVNMASDFYLVKIIGISGLGYGAAIGSLVNAVLVLSCLESKVGISFKMVVRFAAIISVLSLPSAVMLTILRNLWEFLPGGTGSLARTAFLALTVIVYLIIYLFLLNIAKSKKVIYN